MCWKAIWWKRGEKMGVKKYMTSGGEKVQIIDGSFYRRECVECGKVFFVEHLTMWAYKINERYFCTWSCLQKYRRERTGKVSKRKASQRSTLLANSSDFNLRFKAAIEEWMRCTKKAQWEFGSMIGISGEAVMHWKRGDALPRDAYLKTAAAIFEDAGIEVNGEKVNLEYFIGAQNGRTDQTKA